MSKPKALTGKEVLATLVKAGFIIVSQRGSHYRMMNPDSGRKVTTAFHHNEVIKAGTLSGILRDLGISKAEFLELTRKYK